MENEMYVPELTNLNNLPQHDFDRVAVRCHNLCEQIEQEIEMYDAALFLIHSDAEFAEACDRIATLENRIYRVMKIWEANDARTT